MQLSKIKVVKLKIIKNSKGDLLKYLSKKTKNFFRFGEVYFNEIKKKKKLKDGTNIKNASVFFQFL